MWSSWSARCSGAIGKAEKPQLPVISVVTPWQILLTPAARPSKVTSEWVCTSIKPGAIVSPLASTSVRAPLSSDSSPTATITPSRTAMSASLAGSPVPSTSEAFLTRRSKSINAPGTEAPAPRSGSQQLP